MAEWRRRRRIFSQHSGQKDVQDPQQTSEDEPWCTRTRGPCLPCAIASACRPLQALPRRVSAGHAHGMRPRRSIPCTGSVRAQRWLRGRAAYSARTEGRIAGVSRRRSRSIPLATLAGTRRIKSCTPAKTALRRAGPNWVSGVSQRPGHRGDVRMTRDVIVLDLSVRCQPAE